jgi:hypothetical protein
LISVEIPHSLDFYEVSNCEIIDKPIKNLNDETVEEIVLVKQALIVIRGLEPIGSFKNTRGTCFDERQRALLLDGNTTSARPTIPGGPDIYSLAIGQLTGQSSHGTALQRARNAKQKNNAFGIKSGAHIGCAASNLQVWMSFAAENPKDVIKYAESELGSSFDSSMAGAVILEAKKVVDSKVYDDFNEQYLKEVYGKDEIGQAFESLAIDPKTGETIPHEGNTLVRLKVPSFFATNISYIYSEQNAAGVGKGSFVMNDAYADLIEGVWSSGVDAEKMSTMARHAREILLASIANCVPNPTLYQINIS